MSEKNLWNQLRSGDKSALSSIYRQYFQDLYQYGRRFSVDVSTVEDCIQELFIELWQRREKLSETDAIRPYLYISLKRKILRSIKKIKQATDIELEDIHFDAELAIDEIMISSETDMKQRQELAAAFAALSDRQKEILYLKYYSNLDYSEISEMMQLNYQSARNLVSRAIQKLSKHLTMMLLLWYILPLVKCRAYIQ